MLKKSLPVLLLSLVLTGCASHITNLSSLHQPRNASNLYPVELSFDSRQQTIRWQSIHPRIIVGNESSDMRATPLMSNRWEGVISVPPNKTSVEYQYKVDYQFNRMGKAGNNSALSRKYILQIMD
jgi:hypothetical protein